MDVIHGQITSSRLKFDGDGKGVGSVGKTKSADPPFAQDPRWLLIERILATPDFERSPRLTEFLRHVCRLTLEDRSKEISEQSLGEVIFGRSPGFDSSADTIVRSHALRLRHRLEFYFSSEGDHEPLWVEIPRGAYVPRFYTPESLDTNISERVPLGAGRRLRALAALAVIAVIAALVASRVFHGKPGLAKASAAPNLITLAFHDSKDPVVVVQSDEALVLMQSMLGRRFTFEEYTSQSYKQIPPDLKGNQREEQFWNVLAARQIINVGDDGVSTRIRDSLTELVPTPVVQIRSAQNMRPRDFLSGNFILLGDSYSDPWAQMFGEDRFNFQFDQDIFHSPRRIQNMHPKAGELSSYAADVIHNLNYARIAYIPNVTNTGRVLLIAGITMEGTEAAADFCLQPDSVSILRRALGIGNAEELPAFEVLLATSSKSGTGTGAYVVSARANSFHSE